MVQQRSFFSLVHIYVIFPTVSALISKHIIIFTYGFNMSYLVIYFYIILHILSTLKLLCEVSCTVEFYALSHRYLEMWKETNGKCQAWREKNLRNPGLGLQ